MEEHDKNTENLFQTHEETNESSSGCLTWMFILWIVMSIAEGISWLVWVLQGRPDNWYGKIYRFHYKAGITVILIVVVVALVAWLIKHVKIKHDSNRRS